MPSERIDKGKIDEISRKLPQISPEVSQILKKLVAKIPVIEVSIENEKTREKEAFSLVEQKKCTFNDSSVNPVLERIQLFKKVKFTSAQRFETINIIKEYKGYQNQAAFIVLGYSPIKGTVVDAKIFKTQETFKRILEDFKTRNLHPMILPNPVKVSKEFWEKYRNPESNTLSLIKEFNLLKDTAILDLRVFVIDIDSDYDQVFPVWEELKEKLGIEKGYSLVKIKSGRFRAYIFLQPTEIKIKNFYLSIKHLKRACEFVSIVLSFFETKGCNADRTFARLNHPIFVEGYDYDGKVYEEKEGEDGFAGKFYDLYKKIKQVQKENNLWYLGNVYLPAKFWNKKEKKFKQRCCKTISFFSFKKRTENEQLDLIDLWKKSVRTLCSKKETCRYIHVIQPSIGWAKWLGLPEEEVNEYLLSLLGEEKEKDIAKAWRYARPLEFNIPDKIEWAGRTREEWEKDVIAFLKENDGMAFRQDLIKNVFKGQEGLTDQIMWGMVKKGLVEWRKYTEKKGKGRKPYVFTLNANFEILPKAVGYEYSYIPKWLNSNNQININPEKTLINNSSFGEEQRSGLEEDGGVFFKRKERREVFFELEEKKKGIERKVCDDAASISVTNLSFSKVDAILPIGFLCRNLPVSKKELFQKPNKEVDMSLTREEIAIKRMKEYHSKELWKLARETRCYEYFDRFLECKTVQDMAELILFLRMIQEVDDEGIKRFADRLKEIFSESLRCNLRDSC